MCGGNCLFVTASLLLTLSFLAVGISLFGPFWISNLGVANETKYTEPAHETYLPYNISVSFVHKYPDRGLWAQCGQSCFWFWNDDFRLQTRLFTPLKWHLSTQVLYFVAAVLILVSEVLARVHICCDEDNNSRNFMMIGIVVLVSALFQIGGIIAFGYGSSQDPYKAITDPSKFTSYLGQAFDPNDNPLSHPYLGWCYWMAVVGALLSLISGVQFLVAAWCKCCAKDLD